MSYERGTPVRPDGSLCLGLYGSPRGGGCILWARYPEQGMRLAAIPCHAAIKLCQTDPSKCGVNPEP